MPPSRSATTRLSNWQEKLLPLAGQAMALVAPVRVEEISKRLAVGGEPVADSEEAAMLLQAGVIDIALFTAPPGRSTAVERLAKQLRPKPSSDDGKLLAGMLKARLALFEVTGRDGEGPLNALDIMTGEALRIEDAALAAQRPPAGRRFAARLVPVGGLSVVVGAAIPIDDDLLDALSPLRGRDGRGWSNPLRAAETLYRHALRHAVMPDLDDGDFPHSPSDGPLHALAFTWSDRPDDAVPPPAEERQARGFAMHGHALMTALSAVTLARSFHRFGLAAAYERIVALMLDTLQRRAAIGQSSARHLLDWAEAELADPTVPPEARALFRRLTLRAATAEDAELDRLRGRIRALRAKTVEQGCTEEEALAAAEKVADLLDRYGLSLSELELRQQPCEGFGVDTGRKRSGPLDAIVPAIAEFCDCRSWLETTPDKLIRHVFFGLPADTAGARYLYDLIETTVETETARFKGGDLYAEHHSGERASATRSFQTGLVHGIAVKLHDIKGRHAQTHAGSGRDLVPVKRVVIDDELEKLGISFQTKAARAPRVLSDAYDAGREASAGFEYRPGVGGPGDGR